jgi:hypothetical protein
MLPGARRISSYQPSSLCRRPSLTHSCFRKRSPPDDVLFITNLSMQTTWKQIASTSGSYEESYRQPPQGKKGLVSDPPLELFCLPLPPSSISFSSFNSLDSSIIESPFHFSCLSAIIYPSYSQECCWSLPNHVQIYRVILLYFCSVCDSNCFEVEHKHHKVQESRNCQCQCVCSNSFDWALLCRSKELRSKSCIWEPVAVI